MSTAWRKWRPEIVAFFALILIVDWYLYFRHAAHFFQADSIFLLSARASSLLDYLRGFTKLHESGWYRPVGFETLPSILYPLAGLNPIPYHIAVYGLFMCVTIAVYALSLVLSGRHLVAALAASFFSLHTVNAYSTYDVSDASELLYTLLYIVSVWAYFQYLQRKQKWAYRLSLVCFVGGLSSKEAAITLPATLIILHVLMGSSSDNIARRSWQAIRSTLPHMLVLIAYLVFAFGYLHVQNFDIKKIFDRPANPDGGSYYLVIDKAVLTNADFALSWGFNVPRGPWSSMQHPSPEMLKFLKLFRGFVLFVAALLLFRPERKVVLFGIAWCVISLSPALPLLGHFIPYYLFLPVVGLSLVVGVVFAWVHDLLSRIQPRVAAVIVVAVFAGMFYVMDDSIEREIDGNRILGGSARIAIDSLNDVKRLYPTLPAGAVVHFEDSEEPLFWEQSWGNLLRMAYGRNDIKATFASLGADMNTDAAANTIVLYQANQHLIDRTAEYRANPERFIRVTDSDINKLVLSATEVTSGQKYSVTITGAQKVRVSIAYQLDEGPVESFEVQLDADGRDTFEISPQTKKGAYRFIRFKLAGQKEWIRAEKTITVR